MLAMRVLPWRVFMCGAILTNILIAAVMWFHLESDCDCTNPSMVHKSHARIAHSEHNFEQSSVNDTETKLSNKIIFLIRDFEHFENDIADTAQSIAEVLPLAKTLIISDKTVYPPLQFHESSKNNIQIVNLKPNLNKPSQLIDPINYIDKNHIFIFPDSVRLESVAQILKMMEVHRGEPNKIIAARIEGSTSVCLSLNISLRYWTMKYGQNKESLCSALEGDHVLLVTKSFLMQLGFPFYRPLLTSLFIQASLLKIKTKILEEVTFKKGSALFNDSHNRMKHDNLEAVRKHNLYQDFGIKKIIYPAAKVEWHGCRKDTPRCFGTIINNMPEYLFEDRWTPPCCLENLRKTARYVIGILEKCEVRYWLEGGSLLGAVRTGDIIPWDFDVDIGIYKEDIQKCEWLKNTQKQSFVDTQGFLWEKAIEGEFIRVQFSATNHLHVDVFPFYSRNGTMTKDTWFSDHKQDMEFPEHYLKPFYLIKFVGLTVSAPNHYREFLELKFGKGVVENPEYPDPKAKKFSKRNKHLNR